MSEKITLNNVTFKYVTNSTLEHDYHVMSMLSAAGLRNIRVPADASPAAFIEQLFEQLMLTGKLLPVIAALLIPADHDGQNWTKETAAQVERHLRQLTSQADKIELQARMAEMLINFFQSGLAALETTRSFSTSDLAAQAASPAETEAFSAQGTGPSL